MHPSSSETVAAILVGGKGTRLQSLISDIPKPLAPVGGKPFLFHLIELLAQSGIRHIVLLTGYMHEKIVAACGNGTALGVQIDYSHETGPLGTGGAVGNAEHILSQHDDFILLNGDTYYDGSIVNLLNQPLSPNEVGLIGVAPTTDANRFGSIEITPDTQHILAFLEKSQAHAKWVNAGIYKLSKKIFHFIPNNTFISLEQDIFPHLIQQNHILKAVILNSAFHDIGVPESYTEFKNEWQRHTENVKR